MPKCNPELVGEEEDPPPPPEPEKEEELRGEALLECLQRTGPPLWMYPF